MATTQSELMDRLSGQGWSGDLIGGAVTAVIGLVHVFGLQLGGTLGFLLLLVVWPVVGGAIGSRVERDRNGRDWGTTSALTGVFAALVVSLLVFLTGLASVWPGFITTTFGVTFWSVVFTVLVVFTICWTVFGYVGGFIEDQLAGRTDADNDG